ncbi:very short patch repair endonuclease [Qipengyuania sp. JC766]|uniref:very short patch repair endonuclease n=1 Tax=Qipengyuania sp. JC766 TaxID=3232139 RepID=UPI0034597912
MADIVDAKTRSRMMSGIRGKNTKPERLLRRELHSAGLRYRLHDAKLPGKPDLVFAKYHAAVFVHGCFWHRHENCRFATTPATRPEFWESKFTANVQRDAKSMAALLDMGWRVAVVWECALKNQSVELVGKSVHEWLLTSEQAVLEIPTRP